MDENLEERIDFYIHRLIGPHAEDAWHSLNEIGHKGVPLLIERFNKASADLRPKLIEIIASTSGPYLDFYAQALNDPDKAVWNQAVTGLCRIGSAEAFQVLKMAYATIRERTPDKPVIKYLLEAIDANMWR